MNTPTALRPWSIPVLFVCLAAAANAAQPAPFDTPPPLEAVEPLTRGPVHEAYAQPTDAPPGPGPAIPKAPPPPVPEIPPEERPAGDDIEWIPGYWAWDADRNDFLWVSGVYRRVPPDRSWVPGHWVQTPEGYRWVSGFWNPVTRNDIPYVPEPPASLEVGPSVPAPVDDAFYVSGCWVYQDTRYVWRPGYWTAWRPGRFWVAPRYVWCPGGWIYVAGYWDYPLVDRGLLFAPVYFHRPLWRDAGWRWRPYYAVRGPVLFDAFFCHRPSSHFYFGNWYGPQYARAGYRPWFAGPNRYDPLVQYYSRQYRNDPTWLPNLRRAYDDRAAGRLQGPPMKFAQQGKFAGRPGTGNLAQVVAPLPQLRQEKLNLVRAEVPRFNQQQERINLLRETRVLLENRPIQGAGPGNPGKGPGNSNPKGPRTLKLPDLAGRPGSPAPPRPGGPAITLPAPGKGQFQPKTGGDPGKAFRPGIANPPTVVLPKPNPPRTTPLPKQGNRQPGTPEPRTVQPPAGGNLQPRRGIGQPGTPGPKVILPPAGNKFNPGVNPPSNNPPRFQPNPGRRVAPPVNPGQIRNPAPAPKVVNPQLPRNPTPQPRSITLPRNPGPAPAPRTITPRSVPAPRYSPPSRPAPQPRIAPPARSNPVPRAFNPGSSSPRFGNANRGGGPSRGPAARGTPGGPRRR